MKAKLEKLRTNMGEGGGGSALVDDWKFDQPPEEDTEGVLVVKAD